MTNRMLPLGILFNLEKGSLQSTKCTPGEYDFITAAEVWKTHTDYSHECEALIFAAAASGSLGRTHYVQGKFITSDLCFILTPRDEEKYPLNLSFYHFVFNSLRPVLVAATKSGTSKESINQTNFKKYEIPYFDVEQQDIWIGKLKNTLRLNGSLESELYSQQRLLQSLRKQLLWEAIEGKLSKKWRTKNKNNVEPASILLDKVANERKALVVSKAIKKQKSLLPVSQEEKPFELPQLWAWCRLGDVILAYEAGKSFQCSDRPVKGSEWGVIKTSAITSAVFQESENKFYQTQNPNDMSKQIQNGDLIYCRASGSKGLAGKCVMVGKISKNLLLSDKTPRLRVSSMIEKKFIYFLNESKLTTDYYASLTTGKSTSMNNITKDQLLNKPIPIPPLDEQREITTQLEKLFYVCDQIEAVINQNMSDSENLMQSVLDEAFTQEQ